VRGFDGGAEQPFLVCVALELGFGEAALLHFCLQRGGLFFDLRHHSFESLSQHAEFAGRLGRNSGRLIMRKCFDGSGHLHQRPGQGTGEQNGNAPALNSAINPTSRVDRPTAAAGAITIACGVASITPTNGPPASRMAATLPTPSLPRDR